MSAPALDEVTLGEFVARLRASGRRLPLEGTLETTFRCNLNCVHCYVNEPVGDSAARAPRAAPGAAEAPRGRDGGRGHACTVLLTGGEVLVRPDFPELYLYALRKGLLVTVFTNGTLVTERIADLFAAHRPQAVEITPLRDDPRDVREGHPGPRLLRQVPGRDRAPRHAGAAPQAQDHGPHLEPHEVAGHAAPTRAELGLPFSFDALLNPRVDCGAEPQRRAAARRGAGGGPRPGRTPRAHAGLPRTFCAAFVRPRRGRRRTEHALQLRRGRDLLHGGPLRQLQMCQLSRRQLLRPAGRELRARAGTSTSRSCARASGRRTRSAAPATSSRCAGAAPAPRRWRRRHRGGGRLLLRDRAHAGLRHPRGEWPGIGATRPAAWAATPREGSRKPRLPRLRGVRARARSGKGDGPHPRAARRPPRVVIVRLRVAGLTLSARADRDHGGFGSPRGSSRSRPRAAATSSSSCAKRSRQRRLRARGSSIPAAFGASIVTTAGCSTCFASRSRKAGPTRRC